LPPEVAADNLRRLGLERTFSDRRLRVSARDYDGFVWKLWNSGMLEMALPCGRVVTPDCVDAAGDLTAPSAGDAPRPDGDDVAHPELDYELPESEEWKGSRAALAHAHEEAGTFFVEKKNGKLRLVIDARRSNCYFGAPHKVALTSASAIADIELGDTETLWGASCDIKDCFYNIALPKPLRRIFALKGLRAESALWPNCLRGRALQPRLAVLPMGFSWALYWAQRILELAVVRAGITGGREVKDFARGYVVAEGEGHSEYVDNFHALGRSCKAVEEMVAAVVG